MRVAGNTNKIPEYPRVVLTKLKGQPMRWIQQSGDRYHIRDAEQSLQQLTHLCKGVRGGSIQRFRDSRNNNCWRCKRSTVGGFRRSTPTNRRLRVRHNEGKCAGAFGTDGYSACCCGARVQDGLDCDRMVAQGAEPALSVGLVAFQVRATCA